MDTTDQITHDGRLNGLRHALVFNVHVCLEEQKLPPVTSTEELLLLNDIACYLVSPESSWRLTDAVGRRPTGNVLARVRVFLGLLNPEIVELVNRDHLARLRASIASLESR